MAHLGILDDLDHEAKLAQETSMDRRGFIAKAPLAVAGAALGVSELKNNPGGLVNSASPSQAVDYDRAFPASPPQPMPENMVREAAYKLLRESPHIRRQVREQLIESAKYAIGPRQIDPDIAVLKSLSPMAKLTFARQRYVENGLEATLNGKNLSTGMNGRVMDFVGQKVHDLMWGNQSISSILGLS